MARRRIRWVQLMKRTEDPKLAYLEYRLTKMGIPHRRAGRSFHAPILQVEAKFAEAAWALLGERRGRYSLDDVRDDHPSFNGYEPHNLVPHPKYKTKNVIEVTGPVVWSFIE